MAQEQALSEALAKMPANELENAVFPVETGIDAKKYHAGLVESGLVKCFEQSFGSAEGAVVVTAVVPSAFGVKSSKQFNSESKEEVTPIVSNPMRGDANHTRIGVAPALACTILSTKVKEDIVDMCAYSCRVSFEDSDLSDAVSFARRRFPELAGAAMAAMSCVPPPQAPAKLLAAAADAIAANVAAGLPLQCASLLQSCKSGAGWPRSCAPLRQALQDRLEARAGVPIDTGLLSMFAFQKQVKPLKTQAQSHASEDDHIPLQLNPLSARTPDKAVRQADTGSMVELPTLSRAPSSRASFAALQLNGRR
jgi:hypothetical protein